MTSRLVTALTVESLLAMNRYTVTRDLRTDAIVIRDNHLRRTLTIEKYEIAGPHLPEILMYRRWEVENLEKENEK